MHPLATNLYPLPPPSSAAPPMLEVEVAFAFLATLASWRLGVHHLFLSRKTNPIKPAKTALPRQKRSFPHPKARPIIKQTHLYPPSSILSSPGRTNVANSKTPS